MMTEEHANMRVFVIYNKNVSYGAREVVQPIRAVTALAEGSVSSAYTTNYICLLLSFQGI